MPQRKAFPSYRSKKVAGRNYAVVTLTDRVSKHRRDIILGLFDTKESRQRYVRTIAAFDAADRRLPDSDPDPLAMGMPELCRRYTEFAKAEYSRSEAAVIRRLMDVLTAHAFDDLAVSFGPRALRAWRDTLIIGERDAEGKVTREPWARTRINRDVFRVKRMFKWAASYELLPASCYEALRTVESIKRGRTKARETEPVRCAALAAIAAAQAHASTVVSAMISVQQLTGMRPGELCGLRPGLIDRSAPVWIFTPEHHKTEHLNKRRRIFIGPQAQEILRPYLLRGDDCCCFSPADAVREMYEARHESRVTPEGQGNGPGTNVKKRPGCKPGDRYTVTAYNRAISRACDRAGIEHWHAHQLRHTFATEIRKDGGLEASAILLGHSSAEMTDAVYAERDERKAREVIRRLG